LEEFWVLKDINLEVKQGDKASIIGHNGAGKSTFLKILSRITKPTTGIVHIKVRVADFLKVSASFHQ
jgi:lipopolysaccharide transport system ATP-binding protein